VSKEEAVNNALKWFYSVRRIKCVTMTTEKMYDYDPAVALNSPEAIAIFMTDAFETGNTAYIAKALGVVARAKGYSRTPLA
jgi:DNA-binding phage protein